MKIFHLVRKKLYLLLDIASDMGGNEKTNTAHARYSIGGGRSVERRRASKRDRILYYAHIFSEGVEDRRKNFLDRRTG